MAVRPPSQFVPDTVVELPARAKPIPKVRVAEPSTPARIVDTEATFQEVSQELGLRTGAKAAEKLTPGNGTVNLGGGGEKPGATNLNLLAAEKFGGPSNPWTVPNLVRNMGEDIGEIFLEGSVKRLESWNVPMSIGWDRVASGAAKTMAPGGDVFLHVYATPGYNPEILRQAFIKAGFKNVELHPLGKL